jgi:Copper amine oxidase N-terminal domain.
MKHSLIRIVCMLLLVQVAILPLNTVSANTSSTPKEIEGKLANGRVLIPLRSFSEHLRALVEWDNKEKYATITFGDKYVGIKLDGTEVGVNGIIVGLTLDVPMTMFDNVTYLPFSFISSVVGAEVSWNNQIKQATVNYKGQTLLINGKADPKVKLPTKPTQQRLNELYAKVKVAANITDYAQKRQQLAGYFTNELIARVIKNNGLTEYDKRYADRFEEPTFSYANESIYYSSYYQWLFTNDSFYYGEISRNIIFKFESGKWLVADVMTHPVEPRP